MTLRTGIFYLPTFEKERDGSAGQMYERISEQTQHADALDFDGAWFAEHHFQPHGGLLSAPHILIASLAQKARRIRFGLGVIQVPYHHPLSIAEQVATLDHVCHGRLDVGVGRAFLKSEYDGFGIPMNQSRARFTEGVDILLHALRDEQFSYTGQFYHWDHITVQPQLLQQPHPPLWVAASLTPETFEWAGKRGFHLMVAPLLTPSVDELGEKVTLYKRARSQAGHTNAQGEILVTVHIHVSGSDEQARQEAEEGLYRYVHKTQEAGASAIASFMRDGIPEDFARYPVLGRRWRTFTYDEAVANASVVIGSPKTCREKLLYLIEKLQCTYITGVFDFSQEQGSILHSMTLFKEQVLPYIH
jgi:natural product biosynthesis luciferase-like monooxygenase protein